MIERKNRPVYSFISWTVMFAALVLLSYYRPVINPIKYGTDEFYVEIVKIGLENRIISNEEGKIIYAAPSAAEITGYEQSELIGKNIKLLIPERYFERHNKAYKEALDKHDGKVASIKCFLTKKDRSEVAVEIRARVIESELGNVILVTLLKLDKLIEVK